jgi:hypothetical protein
MRIALIPQLANVCLYIQIGLIKSMEYGNWLLPGKGSDRKDENT